MRRCLVRYNCLAAALSLAAGVYLGGSSETGGSVPVVAAREAAAATVVEHRAGKPGLRDASGYWVPLGGYERIVSVSAVADELLMALIEPQRVIAWSQRSATQSPFAYRYAGKPVVSQLSDLERVISLEPDLVVVHSHKGRPNLRERLREAGIAVFDLGEMHGLSTLLPNIVTLATLLRHPERGHELARRFERRMRMVGGPLPLEQRPTALYVAVFGDTLLGGTKGTSYHDVLSAAGLHDVAAAQFVGWPRYTTEQLLQLDPEVIVTQRDMGKALCRHTALDQLRVCRGEGRLIELDSALLGDAGLYMLEATEALYEALHERLAHAD